MSEKLHKESPEQNVFWLCDGKTLKTIHHLIQELKTMDDSIFKYHVNEEKNDFANWLKDIFEEIELDEKLKNIKDKNQYLEIIELHYYPKKKTKVNKIKKTKKNKKRTSK